MTLPTMMNQEQANIRFQRALDTLRDAQGVLSSEVLYSLSDLVGPRLREFQAVWGNLSIERKRHLIRTLVQTAENNFEMDFSSIIHPALHDADMEVRLAAIDGILEDSPRPVVERLMALAQDDPFSDIRAAAASALGMFILQGELEERDQALVERLQDTVLALHRNLNEPLNVRRRALEAISNCGREGVKELIREAYYADELLMRVSSLFAMGRSCDSVWLPQVVEELGSPQPELRFEAARAAGELELRPALRQLIDMAYSDEDREVQEMAIWAMGEIGGSEVDTALNDLAALADDNDDTVLSEVIANAQAAAVLSGDEILPLFDFTDYEIDLEDMEDMIHHDQDDDEDEDESDDFVQPGFMHIVDLDDYEHEFEDDDPAADL